MNSKKHHGPGCKTCPVREHGHCDTATYRGSRCAELCDEIGLDEKCAAHTPSITIRFGRGWPQVWNVSEIVILYPNAHHITTFV